MNMATASKRAEPGAEGETTEVEVVQEDGTKVIIKKQQRRAQAPSNQESGFDSDDGFMMATDKRRVAPREK